MPHAPGYVETSWLICAKLYLWQVFYFARMTRGIPSTSIFSAWLGKETLIRLSEVLTTKKERGSALSSLDAFIHTFRVLDVHDRQTEKLIVWCVWCDFLYIIPDLSSIRGLFGFFDFMIEYSRALTSKITIHMGDCLRVKVRDFRSRGSSSWISRVVIEKELWDGERSYKIIVTIDYFSHSEFHRASS